ncbi:MAG: hypothetical protein AAB558_00645 [Patescibacteria group bacterium]
MHNWSTDTTRLQKKDPNGYAIWKLEQLINFGLAGEKIQLSQLKKYWSQIQIDPARRKFLELFLQGD